jgi:multiple sugar transport system permease protein
MAVSQPPVSVLPTSERRPQKSEPNLFQRARQSWADYLYVAPAIIVMLIVIGYPLVYTIYRSFFWTDARHPDWTWTGLDNYQDILTDRGFWDVTWNTVQSTQGSTVISVVLGFAAALVIHEALPFRAIVRAVLLIPWVISHVAAAYIWKWILHSDYGLISNQLMAWGWIDEPLIFVDSIQNVMPSLILVNVWKEFPFVMIMVLAGLQTVPQQLLRAARVDGASTFQQFIHVTLPQLKGVLIISTLLLAVGNLNSFTLPFLMTGGGPANASQLWITDIYQISFGAGLRYGEASAYSVILFIIMAVLGYFYVRAVTGGSKDTGRA